MARVITTTTTTTITTATVSATATATPSHTECTVNLPNSQPIAIAPAKPGYAVHDTGSRQLGLGLGSWLGLGLGSGTWSGLGLGLGLGSLLGLGWVRVIVMVRGVRLTPTPELNLKVHQRKPTYLTLYPIVKQFESLTLIITVKFTSPNPDPDPKLNNVS